MRSLARDPLGKPFNLILSLHPVGLGDRAWNRVVSALDRTVRKYERVNRVITLGYSDRMRRVLAEMAVLEDGMVVLDAGCGPGNMSAHILRRLRRGKLYCLDPLPSMLKAAFNNLRSMAGEVSLNFLEATFESIPLPDNSVDVIVTSYALRDAQDLYKALEEFKRVLKPGGQLLVLDLVRPDSRIFAALVGLYLRTLVPLISIPIYGSLDTPWKELYPTFKQMLTASEFVNMIGEEFEVIKVKRALLGTFVAIKSRRP